MLSVFQIILKILKTKTVEKLVLTGVDMLYTRHDSPVEKKEKTLITKKVLKNAQKKNIK